MQHVDYEIESDKKVSMVNLNPYNLKNLYRLV